MSLALKYFSVFILSGLKFIFGPALGVIAYDLPILIVIILTACGMMTTVYLFTFFGSSLRSFIKRFKSGKRRTFSKTNRWFVKVWRRFGMKGVCFLTPLLLTPPGGALLINLVSSEKNKIIKWMWISALFWSALLCFLAKYVTGIRELIQSIS